MKIPVIFFQLTQVAASCFAEFCLSCMWLAGAVINKGMEALSVPVGQAVTLAGVRLFSAVPVLGLPVLL